MLLWEAAAGAQITVAVAVNATSAAGEFDIPESPVEMNSWLHMRLSAQHCCAWQVCKASLQARLSCTVGGSCHLLKPLDKAANRITSRLLALKMPMEHSAHAEGGRLRYSKVHPPHLYTHAVQHQCTMSCCLIEATCA